MPNNFNAISNTLNQSSPAKQEMQGTQTLVSKISDLKRRMDANPGMALNLYHDYLENLVNAHERCSEALNWEAVLHSPQPVLPGRPRVNEQLAAQTLDKFKVSMMDKVLGQAKRKLDDLKARVSIARQHDDRIFNSMLKEFRKNTEDWEVLQEIAKGILQRDQSAYESAIGFFDPLAGFSPGALEPCYCFGEQVPVVRINYAADRIVPDFVPVFSRNGRLVNQAMSQSVFHKLSQDHLFSCVLRIGRELFALLPISCIQIDVSANRPAFGDSDGGKHTILSVRFNAEGLRMLHYTALDCSEALLGFPHRVNFSPESGFSAIQILPLENLVTGNPV